MNLETGETNYTNLTLNTIKSNKLITVIHMHVKVVNESKMPAAFEFGIEL